MISLQQAVDARLAALQAQLSARGTQVAELTEQLAEAQRSIAARDAEVARLGARLSAGSGAAGSGFGGDTAGRDQAAGEAASAYDTVILSLNRQVGARVQCSGVIGGAWLRTRAPFAHAAGAEQA
jgi:uncharacterized coiled-coil protein SlyX